MRNYLKLLVVQIQPYESRIINEHNLGTKEEINDKMKIYGEKEDVVGIIIHME